MVVRNTLKCLSCDSKIVTRTQIGHKDMQEHSFQCPNCGVKITFVVDLDQKNAGWSFRNPHNAEWVTSESEKDAIAVLTFSDEIPIPAGLPDMITPFIYTFGNFEDWEKYRDDEGMRRQWVSHHWPIIERCMTHLERSNWPLFDKELPSGDEAELDARERLSHLYNIIQGAFSYFTLSTPSQHARINQRLILATNISEQLIDELAEYLLETGRIVKLWKEITAIRTEYVRVYDSLQPLISMYYWQEKFQNLSAFSLSYKCFDALRQLYIDCFETVCRLLVIIVGIEVIIHDKSLVIPTRKGSMTLEEFESMRNGSKPGIVAKYPIADLFLPFIDSSFRNGIGHHAAHYEKEADTVFLYDSRDSGTLAEAVPYTVFCDRVQKIFAAFELAVVYHHALHLRVANELY